MATGKPRPGVDHSGISMCRLPLLSWIESKFGPVKTPFSGKPMAVLLLLSCATAMMCGVPRMRASSVTRIANRGKGLLLNLGHLRRQGELGIRDAHIESNGCEHQVLNQLAVLVGHLVERHP